MPAPQSSLMKLNAKNKFRSFAIQLPQNWQQPSGEAGSQYGDAFESSEHNTPDTSNRLFVPASTNKVHVDACKSIGDDFESFIDGICDSICNAWQQWMLASTISNVLINAQVGTILPGSIVGPPFFPLAFAMSPKIKPAMIPYSNAITNAIGTAWTTWATGFMGTLNYLPTFNVCPMPVHPPTPNIPMPIKAAGSSPGEAMLQPQMLKTSMLGMLGNATAPHAAELFECVAEAFKMAFDQWTATTQINSVLGFGPVPTFAPPFVPVGPVVMGSGNGIPGAVFV